MIISWVVTHLRLRTVAAASLMQSCEILVKHKLIHRACEHMNKAAELSSYADDSLFYIIHNQSKRHKSKSIKTTEMVLSYWNSVSYNQLRSFKLAELMVTKMVKKERERSSLTVLHLHIVKNKIDQRDPWFSFLLWPFYLIVIIRFFCIFKQSLFFNFSSNLVVEVVRVYELLFKQTWRWCLVLRGIFLLPLSLFFFSSLRKELRCRS